MDKVKGLISIFNFIKEMNKLKYMTAKNIQEQIWHCFISDIPTDSTDVVLTDWQGIQDTADNEERIILWIKKPNFPICPQPPKSIIEWLEPGWDKYDTQVRYKKSLPGVSKEQIINFTDDEKREKDFQQWIKEREEWQKEYNKIRIVRNLFVELYNRYIDLGKSPDTIEFLCGSGLIRDKRNPHISHPILLKRCQIKFEAADNIIKICDTDVEPQICTEVLSFIDEINSDKVGVYQNRLQEESIHPFDKQNATKFLRELTHELCAESEFFDNNNANSKERITVVFSPTFFIRKRIDGAVRATEKVIAAIENKGEIPHHLLELPEASSQRILPTDYEEPDISRKLAALNGESTEILLSKEANSEQLQIAERIAKEDAVIVQGPPGTGKTHTIANLIGHFLAEGKSILVTSHTRKALSVLKEKLPKELQGLCVSILEDSNRDMERSIDSITDYYDISLKYERLDELKAYGDRFTFIHNSIADRDAVVRIFDKHRPTVVVNLAAQAGVRYSITNPDAYIESNIIGFYNILEACRHSYDKGQTGVEHLVYASSSSVYGANKKVPYSTDDQVDNPISLYAATKKSNELLAHAYSKLYNIPSTGLRFFTVYGPCGRPDMAYFSFTDKLVKEEKIKIFNYGNCKRDFTYIDDIVEGVVRVMQHAPERRDGEDGLPLPLYKVYNIGNSSPENLLDFVTILQEELVRAGVLPKNYDFESHKELVSMQPGDVPVTYADTTPLEQDFGFKPSTPLRTGLRNFAEWYSEHNNK